MVQHQLTLTLCRVPTDGFVYVYSAEFAIKVIGLGPWQYLEDGWNKFDFLVLVGSYLEEILTSIGVRPTTFRVLRIPAHRAACARCKGTKTIAADTTVVIAIFG